MGLQRTDRLTLRQTVAPTSEPIPLADAKLHCRVSIGDDDSLITALIGAARAHVENLCHRQLMTATWRLSLDQFPYLFDQTAAYFRPSREGTDILLPRPPLASVSSITYLDGSGNLQTVDPTTYIVSLDDEPGRIALVQNAVWPYAQFNTLNAVQVTYVTGYAASALIPMPLILAMKLLIGHWYEHRESVTIGSMPKIMEQAVEALCSPYVVRELW